MVGAARERERERDEAGVPYEDQQKGKDEHHMKGKGSV
jgi:hypothetical protein